MQETFVVNAEVRDVQGTGASRRLRRAGKVPAILYGGNVDAQNLTIEHREIIKHLETEAFYSHVLTIKVGGAEEQAVLKDVQRHPYRLEVLHVDFQRVRADQAIHMLVPLHFKGEEVAPGVKIGGGRIEHLANEVEVECLPKDLPEFIEVDVSGLDVDDPVHLSALKLPAGVQLVELKHDNDLGVVVIHSPPGASEDAGDEEA